ncbi:MAG: HDOD domain-containing protein [Spirochaeta sp.]|jgi:putative nucleotidyltransferase with HDIG domain|nr:HDOD domain-containing protein [Spirochaeta sp.]
MGEEQGPTVIERAREAARAQTPFIIKSHTLPPETEGQIEEVLGVFLDELERSVLKDSIAYCLRELTVNGKKANTKRVYFEEKGLQLENNYKVGMENFKQETLDNIAYWLEKQEAADLYVRVVFHIQGRDLLIKVANNTVITRKEQIRIYDRIARSRAFRTMEEAMTTVLDDSEGAGLGIVILVLMLKKLGLDEESFDIDVEGNETVARLSIPMDKTKGENLTRISDELANHINSLPQFPENILTLRKMLEDPDSEMTTIARTLGQDPSLTADLLRTVNSARYMLPRRMDNVVEAVKVVGLRGLRQMLLSYGTQRVLGDGEDNATTRQLWDHSQRTAFFAYGIARHVFKRKDILDDVYVGGILHDMGKIVFSSLHPDTVARIQTFSREKGIPSSVFEEMSDGIDHAEVGARLATQWNFPDVLVETIRHHHTPLKADGHVRDVVAVVYLANELAKITTNDFSHIDARVLRIVRVKDLDQLGQVHRKLGEQYDREYARPER